MGGIIDGRFSMPGAMSPRLRLRRSWSVRPALLGAVAMGLALQAPLALAPAAAQGQQAAAEQPAGQQSSAFQPVPPAIEKTQIGRAHV